MEECICPTRCSTNLSLGVLSVLGCTGPILVREIRLFVAILAHHEMWFLIWGVVGGVGMSLPTQIHVRPVILCTGDRIRECFLTRICSGVKMILLKYRQTSYRLLVNLDLPSGPLE